MMGGTSARGPWKQPDPAADVGFVDNELDERAPSFFCCSSSFLDLPRDNKPSSDECVSDAFSE